MATSIQNRDVPIYGARYRVCPWHDIGANPARIVGYGLDEKAPGARRYTPVGWKGAAQPWGTLAQAQQAVAEINKQAGTCKQKAHDQQGAATP